MQPHPNDIAMVAIAYEFLLRPSEARDIVATLIERDHLKDRVGGLVRKLGLGFSNVLKANGYLSNPGGTHNTTQCLVEKFQQTRFIATPEEGKIRRRVRACISPRIATPHQFLDDIRSIAGAPEAVDATRDNASPEQPATDPLALQYYVIEHMRTLSSERDRLTIELLRYQEQAARERVALNMTMAQIQVLIDAQTALEKRHKELTMLIAGMQD